MTVYITQFLGERSLEKLLDESKIEILIRNRSKIVIKPNLVTYSRKYPVTSDPKIAEFIIKYLKEKSGADIIVAEGSGDDTFRAFKNLGWLDLAQKLNIRLEDLNYSETISLKNENANVLKEFHFPKILENSFLISLANLKAHHITKVTLSLKNMFGIAPGKFYSHNIRGKPWQKEHLHDLGVEKCIVDINRYKLPDFAIIDGRYILMDYERGTLKKYSGIFLVGSNPIEVDYIAKRYLCKESVWYIEELAKLYKINLSKIRIIEV